jgi:hypothetical protein
VQTHSFSSRRPWLALTPIPASRCARATVAKGRSCYLCQAGPAKTQRDLLNLLAPVRPPCRGFFMSTRVITRASSLGFAALLRRYISSKLRSMPRLTTFVLLLGVGLNLSSCTKKLDGNTSFNEARKGFQKELTTDQRKTAIKQLQTETAGKP